MKKKVLVDVIKSERNGMNTHMLCVVEDNFVNTLHKKGNSRECELCEARNERRRSNE